MTYNEIKSCIDKTRKEIFSVKKSLELNEEEQSSLKKQLAELESSHQLNLREEHDKALDEFINQNCAKFDENIASLQSKIDDTHRKYDVEMQALGNFDVNSAYSDEQAMTAEIRAALDVLQHQLSKSISSRFQNTLEEQLATQTLDIQEKDVDLIVHFFNKQSRNIERMSSSGMMDRAIDNMLRFVRVPAVGEITGTKEKATVGFLSVLAIVAFFFLAKYVFPVYVVILGIVAVYNLGKHYRIYAALTAQKAVKDNLEKIEGSLRDKAEKRLEAKKDAVRDKYDGILLELENSLAEESHKRDSSIEDSRKNFKYDSANVQSRYQNALKIKNSRLNSVITDHDRLNQSLQDLKRTLTNYENQLDRIAGDIQTEYLNFDKIGSAVTLDPKFIVDIKNSKPVFFMHPKSSLLILYNSQEDMDDLIRLLIIQLRIKLNPYNLLCTVIDTEDLGLQFLPFNTDGEGVDETIKNLFKIITTADVSRDFFNECSDRVAKRISTIRKSYADIDEYNLAMVESDSLTEAYEFIFVKNPMQQLLTSETFKRVFAVGGQLGLITHIFIRQSDFYDMGDIARNLVDKAGGIFVLKDGAILRRAKEFALENLIKPTD